MADPLPPSAAARFRIWIRRRAEPQGPYSIRFEVTDGKGILRVVRPGVLVDPPARPSGFEERLTAAQVNTSRFLHVWDGGRYRQGHSFARLDEPRLESLPPERWIALESAAEGTLSMLLLPADLDTEPARVDDEPTWPRRKMLAELQGPDRSDAEDIAALEEPTDVRGVAPLSEPPASRAERVALPSTPARALPQPAPRVAESLDALLQASVANASRDVEEDQTLLIGSASLAMDRALAGARTSGAPWPPGADDAAIEAGEAADDDDDSAFDVVALDAHAARFGGPDLPEVVDFGRPPMPETFARELLTEAVTVMPLFDLDTVAGVVEIVPSLAEDTANLAIEAGEDDYEDEEAEEAEEAEPDTEEPEVALSAPHAFTKHPEPEIEHTPSDEAPRHALRNADHAAAAPALRAAGEPDPTLPDVHERNTTLVRFLRRRIAADRLRIAALEHRVAELEEEIVRRSAR